MIVDVSQIQTLRKSGERWVMAVGCFDLLHPGHIDYLSFAKQQGDKLVVALQNDATTRFHKGNDRPIVDELSRARVIDALSMTDYTIIGGEPYATFGLGMSRVVKPDLIVIYQDWLPEKIKELQEKGVGEVIVFKKEKDYSASDIIEKIKQLDR